MSATKTPALTPRRARPPIGPRARARVYLRGGRVHVQIYNVATGQVLAADSTGAHAWALLVAEAHEDAFAFHRVLVRGQELKPWSELVDAVSEEL